MEIGTSLSATIQEQVRIVISGYFTSIDVLNLSIIFYFSSETVEVCESDAVPHRAETGCASLCTELDEKVYFGGICRDQLCKCTSEYTGQMQYCIT